MDLKHLLVMDFGKRMANIRKEKKISRDDLGKLIGTSGAIIGRYERDEMKPSIETAAKIASVLEVSLDYLVGNSSLSIKDKKTIERIEDIDGMPKQERNQLYNVVDALIRDFKLRNIAS